MTRKYQLLGMVAIEEAGQPSPLLDSQKGLALLAYLIVTQKVQRREAVADLLWESTTTSQSLARLRVLLTRVRKWIPELVITRKSVAFVVQEETIVDLMLLEEALTSGDLYTITQTLPLYQGDLLRDFYLEDAPHFNEWLAVERERLRQRVLAAYRRVCQSCATAESWSQGIESARHWLALDAFSEEALRWLMQLLAGGGQVQLALEEYDAFRHHLWQELEIHPEVETNQLARHLADQMKEIDQQVAVKVNIWEATPLPDRDTLSTPGMLPPHSYLPFRRNNDFQGRTALLLQLARALLPWSEAAGPANQPVAITGIGGLGKTQLAVEFSFRYGRYYEGGVYWLNFADSENIEEEVAFLGSERGMGLFMTSDRLSLADRLARVEKACQEKTPRLLIFDNCEEEALLARWLPVSGGSRVLLTSRRSRWARELNVLALPLPTLNSLDSVALLQQLAPALAEVEAVRVAYSVGHLPLALHLAGSFLNHYPQVTPDQYLNQLQETGLRHPSLVGRGMSYSPTSHELSVADTFAVSWGQLNPDNEVDALARQLQARAAHFAPGEPLSRKVLLTTVRTSTDILQQLLVEDGLTRLLDLGLMKAEGPETVIVHRLLADFSLEATRDDQSAQATVEKAVLTALVNPEKKTLTPLNQLPLSFGHLRHVTDAAIARNSQLAARIGIAFAQYLYLMADYAAAQKYLETILSQKAIHKDTDEQIQIFLLLSDVLGSQSLYQQALQAGEQAEMFCREEESLDRIKLSKILSSKSWILIWLGQAEAARIAAEEALVHATASKEPSVIVSCLNLTAVIHYYILEQFESGQKYLEDALALYKTEAVVQYDRSAILTNLGNCLVAQGKPAEAIPYIQQALAMTQESGHRTRKLNQRTNLMGAWVALGAYETAVNGLLELITQAPPGWRVLSEAYCFLGNAYLGLGQHEAALAAGQNGLAVAMETENAREVAHAWLILGRAAGLTDQPVSVSPSEANLVDAATCFDKSLAQFVDLGLKRDQALVLWHWASYEIASGKRDAGQARRKAAREILIALRLPALLATMEKQIEGFG